jgi:hypothetical protein
MCYLCGELGADTRDHVVPKLLHVPPLPSDLLTLPAHRSCNGSIRLDEEWVANIWSTSGAFEVSHTPLWRRRVDALKRPEAAGLRTALLKNLYSQPEPMVTIDPTRQDIVLAKIVRGLVLDTNDFFIPNSHRWAFAFVQPSSFFEAPTDNVSNQGTAVAARWVVNSSGEMIIAWLAILGQHHVMVVAGSGERLARNGFSERCREVAWPKPAP